MTSLKSPSELTTMREAGRVVARVLEAVAAAAKPGVRLVELDALADDLMRSLGARSSFKGYRPSWAPSPYPGVLCLSVNDQIVHGIPNGRALRAGDLLSIDFGASVDGYHGDAAITVPIGRVDAASERLSEATARALEAGIAAARPGNRLGDIGHAVEMVADEYGYGIPDGLGGHGVGRAMHEGPSVPNTGQPGRGMVLREGLVIAIEPQFTLGGRDDYRTGPDGWTVVTTDGSRAAHFEHTIAITAASPAILTAP